MVQVTVVALTLAMLLVHGSRSQELNGHINPLWVSSNRDRLSVLRVPSDLRLYFLDPTGALRPFHPPSSARSSLANFRSQNRDYSSGPSRSGYYNRVDNPYGFNYNEQ